MRLIRFIAIILAVLTSTPLLAQHYFGVRGGAGAGNVRFNPSEETQFYLATPLAGISYKYYGGDKYLGGIQVDASILERGYNELPRMNSDSTYTRTISGLQLAFLWQPHIPMFHDKARFFINAGPYVGYDFYSTEKFVTKELGVVYDREYVYDLTRDNKMGYGLTFGAGYGVTVAKRIDIQAEFRYDFGFSGILKSTTRYPSNPYESPMDFLNVVLGVYYKIGKTEK